MWRILALAYLFKGILSALWSLCALTSASEASLVYIISVFRFKKLPFFYQTFPEKFIIKTCHFSKF